MVAITRNRNTFTVIFDDDDNDDDDDDYDDYDDNADNHQQK